MPAPFSILVISDDPQVVKTLDEVSLRSDKELIFRSATDTREAVNVLNDFPYTSLIVLDSTLRSSSQDLEFIASLRVHPDWIHRPILVLLDGQPPCDLVAAYGVNATSVSFKPYNLSDWNTYWQMVLQVHGLHI
ncbi:CheY-like chemotaxis protein [Larkinella arboricola]|uniref:CheY-like chemotaxis protein n=1 Tax=Larkinella arboricola TaxID=643671 RepID=A0A327WN99_LARAB|nr:hypothetical protein [Larkinella arboricola]RAJ93075.1 CheY-like chemotaxis protein [Larkinella arboricola]